MKILLIGGGTGGHIFPLRNLASELIKKKASVEIVVNDAPLDRAICTKNFSDIKIHYFRTGKIRRYVSWENIKDFFRIVPALFVARKMLKQIHPDVLFFKGGFVGFPFLIAARYLMKFSGKIYAHESDISAGVMTRLAHRLADEVFESFHPTNPMPLFYQMTDTSQQQTENRETHCHTSQKQNETPNSVGTRHDQSAKNNSTIDNAQKTKSKRPHILVFGGSQGAQFLNNLIEQKKEELLKKYDLHIVTGKNKKLSLTHPHFSQDEFLTAQKLAQHIHAADLVIARAGANSLFEIIAAKRPSIIIPLPSVARNHQMLNAQYFEKQHLCHILKQTPHASEKLLPLIHKTLQDKKLHTALQKSTIKNNAQKIAEKLA